MSTAAYSAAKVLAHPERLCALRAGKQPYPVHLHIVLSDLCNLDCGYCLVSDTMISTPDGERPIASLSKGDVVFGASGNWCQIETVSNRAVSDVYEVTIGKHTIRGSGEHPVLTQEGWKPIRRLTSRDSAVVRVRLRKHTEMEPSVQAMGSLHIRTSKKASVQVCDPNGDIAQSEGLRKSSAVPLWMRTCGSGTISWDVEQVFAGSCTEGRQERYGATACDSTAKNVDAESDEECRNVRQGFGEAEGIATSANPRGDSEVCGWCEEVDAIRAESDAELCCSQSSNGENPVSTDQQKRDALCGMGITGATFAQAHRGREFLDRAAQPRFQNRWSEKASRSDAEGMLCRQAENPHAGDLRQGNDCSLRKKSLAMFGGIQGWPPLTDSCCISEGGSQLCSSGIQLECGLALRPIDSVRRIAGATTVYNFSCLPDESYEANGVVVHNCSYRVSGGQATELFATKATHNPARFLDTELAKRILDDCVAMGTRAVEFTGGGEPTVHPDARGLLGYAQGLGLETALVTNGIQLHRMGDAAVGTKWLRISVDAAEPETYRHVRPSFSASAVHFDEVLEEIQQVRLRRDVLRTSCAIGFGFVVQRNNWREIVAATDLAFRLGCDDIRIAGAFMPEGVAYHAEYRDEALRLEREAVRQYHKPPLFSVYDRFHETLADMESRPTDPRCGYEHFTSYVGGDGNLYRCCVTSYSQRGLIGNIREAGGLRQLWESQAKRAAFDSFDARQCRDCRFRAQLDVINAAVDAAELPPAPQGIADEWFV